MPGTRASIPNFVLPVTLSGVSSRLGDLPTIWKSFGSFSGPPFGTGNAEAAVNPDTNVNTYGKPFCQPNGWVWLDTLPEFKVMTRIAPTAEQLRDLAFAWRVVKHVKSNAIVYARDGLTLGIGAGQPSRIMSARIAALKAGEAKFEVKGSVMASDAFLPFRDSVGAAAHTGISAIVQPGGSMRDKEVISAADELKIAMVFTGMRHFRH